VNSSRSNDSGLKAGSNDMAGLLIVVMGRLQSTRVVVVATLVGWNRPTRQGRP
jgi:hypothetical protein